jgi:hypothetical protein
VSSTHRLVPLSASPTPRPGPLGPRWWGVRVARSDLVCGTVRTFLLRGAGSAPLLAPKAVDHCEAADVLSEGPY